MEKNSMIKEFRTIGRINSVISKAESLDEAVGKGLNEILNGLDIEFAAVWHQDKNGDGALHPYYWVAPVDLTEKKHAPGQGTVGRVFSTQQPLRILDYPDHRDPETDRDFEGVEIASMVCVPLSDMHGNSGCIQFINSTGSRRITEEEAEVCKILSLLAAEAIDENDRLGPPLWKEKERVISARNIFKEFRNGDTVNRVLKGVNLDIYEGEFLAILGESGCGKSTFLNILGGLDRATSGSFTYRGENITDYTEAQLTGYRRKNMGFIFQNYNLMPNLTAKQNLDLIGELVEDPMDSLEALKLVGLEEKSGNYPSQLSGGQQQRVSIARALVKRPGIIFADEPTAALDYATGIEVLEVLEKVMRRGTTLVMVTHNEEIAKMADRVVRMRGGRIREVTVNKHPLGAKELVW